MKGTSHPVDVKQKGTMNPETGTRHPDVSRHLSMRLPDDTATRETMCCCKANPPGTRCGECRRHNHAACRGMFYDGRFNT